MSNPKDEALEQAGKAMKVLGYAYLIFGGYTIVVAIWAGQGQSRSAGLGALLWTIFSVVPFSLAALMFTLRRSVCRKKMWAVSCAMLPNVLVSAPLLISFRTILLSVYTFP